VEEGCKGCYYNTSTECLILKERQKNCSSKADREEAEKREEAIKEYKSIAMPVKCEPVREKLKKHFMKLYRSGYNDTEISEILKISQSSVNDYRKSLNLKTQSERRKKEPTAMGK
jgi:DNA-directed RNA polymerase specialized sigma24 family protein